MLKQTIPFFYVNKTKTKHQATLQKSEVKIFNRVIYNTLGFKYMDVIYLALFSSFVIYKNMQLWAYNK